MNDNYVYICYIITILLPNAPHKLNKFKVITVLPYYNTYFVGKLAL